MGVAVTSTWNGMCRSSTPVELKFLSEIRDRHFCLSTERAQHSRPSDGVCGWRPASPDWGLNQSLHLGQCECHLGSPQAGVEPPHFWGGSGGSQIWGQTDPPVSSHWWI